MIPNQARCPQEEIQQPTNLNQLGKQIQVRTRFQIVKEVSGHRKRKDYCARQQQRQPPHLQVNRTFGRHSPSLSCEKRWAVTPTSISSFELPKRTEIETAAKQVCDLLKAEADADFSDALTALSQVLLGPVAEQLGTKRLLIVADGALQYVPFSALPAPKGGTEERVTRTEMKNQRSSPSLSPQSSAHRRS